MIETGTSISPGSDGRTVVGCEMREYDSRINDSRIRNAKKWPGSLCKAQPRPHQKKPVVNTLRVYESFGHAIASGHVRAHMHVEFYEFYEDR